MVADLTLADLEAVAALWGEWVDEGWDLDVVVVGEHQPAVMDPDRPLAAVVRATLSLRVRIYHGGVPVFDEACPYDGVALRASVAALARTIGER